MVKASAYLGHHCLMYWWCWCIVMLHGQNYKKIETDCNLIVLRHLSAVSNVSVNKSSATAEDGRPYESS